MKVKKQDFLFFILAAFLILVAYGDIFKTFFQQDEWSSIGRFMYLNSQAKGAFLGSFWEFLKKYLVRGYGFAPFGFLVYLALVKFFGLKFSAYAATSLCFHLANTILVFYLVEKITGKKKLAFLSGLFFAVNSPSYHAITWVQNFFFVQGAALFSILSLVFFLNYLRKKKRKLFCLTTICLLIALGFKEMALFLFPFFFFYWRLFKKENFDQRAKKDCLFLLSLGIFYLLTRLILSLVVPQETGLVQAETPVFSFSLILYQTLTVPLKALSQVFIFPKQIFSLSEKWVELSHPFLIEQKLGFDPNALFQTIGAEFVSYVLMTIFFLVWGGLYLFLKKKRCKPLLQAVRFGFLMVVIGVLPSVLLLVRGTRGILILVRSRDLYIPSIGGAMFLGTFVMFLAEEVLAKRKKILANLLILLMFFPLFNHHRSNLKNNVFPVQIERARQRKKILSQIMQTYPEIAPKSIFYTESDMPYYGHAEPSLPFQTGAGRSILLWYVYYTKSHPLKFFEDDFLYLFNEEGYREISGKGFGYFLHFDKLIETLEERNLPPESVYAFSWKGEKDELIDITDQIRERIKKLD